MITLEALLIYAVGMVVGFLAAVYATRKKQTVIISQVVSAQIKGLNSRARAAEATVVELNVMLEHFRTIIEQQATMLKILKASEPG